MEINKRISRPRGITLVALIITIIVMLILAGVSIQVVINSDLIGTAQDAADRTQTSYDQEGSMDEIKVDGKIYANMEDYTNGIQKIFDDSLPENEYLKTFITEWTVEAGDTITLPIYEMEAEDETRGEVETYFNYNFIVDYGDGTIAEVTSFNDTDRTHTYETEGTYKIKIDGQCEGWSFAYVTDSAEKVTKLEQWGVVGAKHIDFRGCTNLAGEIPVPSLNSFNEVLSFRRLFMKCANLTGSIPSNLFEYATKLITLKNAFQESGVSGSIPENLLTNCTELTNVGFLFSTAKGLTGEIPENLLKQCNKLVYAESVFSGCPNLTGNIPSNLFSNCSNIQNVNGLFKNSTGLSGEIPSGLFSNCNDLKICEETFMGCTGLTGAIPTDLFINNSRVWKVEKCFSGCSGLEDSVVILKTTNVNTDARWEGCFEGINANITVKIPTGSYTPSSLDIISSTANITIVEYDL